MTERLGRDYSDALATYSNGSFLEKVGKFLVDKASEHRLQLRIFGGIGVKIMCPKMAENGFRREYRNNLDIAAPATQGASLDDFFHRSKRLQRRKLEFYVGGEYREYEGWMDDGRSLRLDIWCGRLRFSHEIPPPYFCGGSPYTLPISTLLLSKLAIENLTPVDIFDIGAILAEHGLSAESRQGSVSQAWLQDAWFSGWHGWGLRHTCLRNIQTIKREIRHIPLSSEIRDTIVRRLDDLLAINSANGEPLLWKVRKMVGTRVRWYHDTQPAANASLTEGVRYHDET